MTLARTPLGRAGRGTTTALVLASNAPDIDFVGRTRRQRRSTSSGIAASRTARSASSVSRSSTAGIVVLGRRLHPTWRREDDASFGTLVAVSLIGVLLHVLMDLPTSYGIRLLSPFSWRWYSVDWMPIVDVYLLIVLVSGLLFGRVTEEARRRNAVIVLTFVAIIYGVRGAAHRQALDLAPVLFGPTLPPRCDPPSDGWVDSWPKPVPSMRADGRRCLVEIAALPTFSSPFDWRIVAQTSNAFELHDINVLDRRYQESDAGAEEGHFWRQAIRYPECLDRSGQAGRRDTPRSASSSVSHGFRRRARRTTRRAPRRSVSRTCDSSGPGPLDERGRASQLFTATIRFDAQGRVVSETLGR